MVKTLKFEPDLIPAILDGSKTTTWRLFDDKNLSVGDQIEVVNSETLEQIASVVVTEIKVTTLGNISESDFQGHEGYSSKNSMVSHFKQYYGERVTLEAPLKIVTFEVIKN